MEGASSERAALGESPFLSNRFAHHDEWRSPPEDLYERNDFQMPEHGVLLEFLTSFLSKKANVQIPGGLTVSCQDLAAVVLVVVGLLTMAISVGAGCSSSKTGPGAREHKLHCRCLFNAALLGVFGRKRMVSCGSLSLEKSQLMTSSLCCVVSLQTVNLETEYQCPWLPCVGLVGARSRTARVQFRRGVLELSRK